MNSALMDEFVATMTELAADERLRAVVLNGAGPKAFIVGADINEMAGIKDAVQATGVHHPAASLLRGDPQSAGAGDRPHPRLLLRRRARNGGGLRRADRLGGGLFGMPEVKLGIPSVIEAALLPTLVGWGRAREIMLLGETFTAAAALAWRLVEHVVPAAALDEAVEGWIGKLLTSKPRAVRLQKRLIRHWEDLPLAAAVQAGIEAFADAYCSQEPVIAMREFLSATASAKNPQVALGTNSGSGCFALSPCGRGLLDGAKTRMGRGCRPQAPHPTVHVEPPAMPSPAKGRGHDNGAAISLKHPFALRRPASRAPETRRNARTRNSPRNLPARRPPWPAKPAAAGLGRDQKRRGVRKPSGNAGEDEREVGASISAGVRIPRQT